jgi:hypothetical protein
MLGQERLDSTRDTTVVMSGIARSEPVTSHKKPHLKADWIPGPTDERRRRIRAMLTAPCVVRDNLPPSITENFKLLTRGKKK